MSGTVKPTVHLSEEHRRQIRLQIPVSARQFDDETFFSKLEAMFTYFVRQRTRRARTEPASKLAKELKILVSAITKANAIYSRHWIDIHNLLRNGIAISMPEQERAPALQNSVSTLHGLQALVRSDRADSHEQQDTLSAEGPLLLALSQVTNMVGRRGQSRVKNDALDPLIFRICQVWQKDLQLRLGTSLDGITGDEGGPLIRFIQTLFAGVRAVIPDEVKESSPDLVRDLSMTARNLRYRIRLVGEIFPGGPAEHLDT